VDGNSSAGYEACDGKRHCIDWIEVDVLQC
jgi:hypothetical protein